MAKIPIILEAGRADGKLIKTNSVYDDNQEKFLSDKIEEIDSNHNTLIDIVNNNELDIETKLEVEKTRATNAENNLRETINNITDINEHAATAELISVNTLPNSTVSNVQQALNELFKNATYAGIATPDTNPNTPNAKVFYIADGKGVYTNFGGISVTEDEVVILYYDTAWHKEVTGIASNDKLTELVDNIVGKEKYDTYVSTNSWRSTTITLQMLGGRKVRLTNLSNSGYSSNDINIYYNEMASSTILYSHLILSKFPFEFILPFDVSAIVIVDNGELVASSPNQKWQLEYQNDILGTLPGLEKYTKDSLNGFKENLYYSGLRGQSISPSIVVGEAISFVDNGLRSIYRFNVTGLQGKIRLENIMADGNDKDVIICDSEDIVIAIVSYQISNDITYSTVIDMSDYQDAMYIYVVGHPTSPVTAYNYSEGIIKMCENTDTLPKKGALLLHFDNSITPGDPRIGIIEEYGFKVSWCISSATFSNTGDFSGDWTSEEHRQLYWRLIENGADIGIYPDTILTTEAEWDRHFERVLPNLSAKGIYNITTLHCGKLVVNDGLLASAPKYGIHILRGGGYTSDGDTYPYTEENLLVPIKPSQKTLYVLKSEVIGTTNVMLGNRLDNAIERNRVYSIFSHGIGTGTTDISEEAFRRAMDTIASKVAKGLTLVNWREFYRMMNPIDGSSNDYLRLLKMAKRQ